MKHKIVGVEATLPCPMPHPSHCYMSCRLSWA